MPYYLLTVSHPYEFQNLIQTQQPRDFAVKQLHVPDPDDYHKEVQVLEKLVIENKETMSYHLILLQLAFSHGRDYFMMFPWADGNLKQFWQTRRAYPSSPSKHVWFFNQCLGISRGLRKIHHLSTQPKEISNADNASPLAQSLRGGDKEWGRHRDIKPENTFWFDDYDGRRDHLVITDFGLTLFNSVDSRPKVLRDQIQGFSGKYRPPGLHLGDLISQRYDVRSFGCVLLEFTSWFLLGYELAVVDFPDTRHKLPTEETESCA
ncbi:hypothetical protein FZEAL_6798 [Fusarium zealandicum]|uniref:Protein kinase domain-containing protein n=1 Tax=Fusarium zealandicum TaxID=1053134 RepID=A0A8H4XJI3_9HYPO|nr:hypothetical protein FZEAL_6798 [Fusarium zealandicum]